MHSEEKAAGVYKEESETEQRLLLLRSIVVLRCCCWLLWSLLTATGHRYARDVGQYNWRSQLVPGATHREGKDPKIPEAMASADHIISFLASPGTPTVPWGDWILDFETYAESRDGSEKWDDRKRCAVLLNHLGPAGHKQYRAIANEAAAGKTEYARIVERLTRKFASRQGVVTARIEFNRRRQRPGETFMEYFAELRQLANRCQFEKITPDDLIVTQLVAGTTSSEIRKRLSTMETLTLDETPKQATRIESAL